MVQGKSNEKKPPWWVYLLRSTGTGRTYIGVTCDLDRRLAEHNGERPGGARATRAGRPWMRVHALGPMASRSLAQRVEAQLKRLPGPSRQAAFETYDSSALEQEPQERE